MSLQFKQKYNLEERQKECGRIKKRYPARIPVIVDKRKGSTLQLDRHKYLVPEDLTVGQFLHVLRKRIQLDDTQALFLFSGNAIIPPIHQQISLLERDEDGFIYFVISEEGVFG